MGKRVQWDVCKKNNILVPEKMVWAETGTLWLRRGGQTLFIIDKVKKACQIVDFAVLYHTRVNVKETEKLEKYQIFFYKTQKFMEYKVRLFPWLLGGWEQRQRAYATEWKKLGLRPEHKELQKIIIIHSARIVRKVLEISACWQKTSGNYNIIDHFIHVKTIK